MAKKIILIFVLISGFTARVVQAQQAASVMDSNSIRVKVESVSLFKEQGIPFLKWSKESYILESSAFTNYANITGKVKEKVVSATVNGRLLAVNPDGSFNVRLEFAGEEKSFILTMTDTNNKIYRMQYKISQYDPKAMRSLTDAIIPFRWRFSAGAGLTLISYRQQDTESFDQNVVTIKAGAVYKAIPDKLDLGVGAFFNLLPISSNSPEGNKIQYLGVNLRAGLHVIDAPSPVRFTLNGGFYFNNSYGTVGFANMYGPQISPEFLYVLNNGHSIFWYVKYAYSLFGAGKVSLKDNREVATGVHYSFPFSGKKRISIGIDLSQLSLSLADGWASTNTYSLSGGISF